MADHPVTSKVLHMWDDGYPLSQISRKTCLSHNAISTIVSKYRGGHDSYRQWCIDMRIGSQKLLEAIKRERQQAQSL